jgi:hypothetical protein
MKLSLPNLSLIAPLFLAIGCASTPESRVEHGPGTESLVGAWRGKIQFTSGSFATVKDLEFMYVFNAGGTMTESSNYDSSPPVPPAYGVWKRSGPSQYEAKYEFFSTKPPAAFDEITKGGGWSPAGRGVLVEKITVAPDGKSLTSTVKYDAVDQTGKATETGSEARGEAVRIGF